MTAASDLHRVTNPEVPPLSALENPDPAVRLNAALALTYNGDDAARRAALPALVEGLGHESKVVRLVHVVGALVEIGSAALAALSPLLDLHSDASGRIRTAAALAAHRIDPATMTDPAVGAIVQVLHSGGDEEREDAARILGDIGKPARAAQSDLLHALADPSEPADVRINALLALGAVGESEHIVQPLADALGGDGAAVVGTQGQPLALWAAVVLGGLGPAAASAVDALIALHADPDAPADTRAHAGYAPAQIVAPPESTESSDSTNSNPPPPIDPNVRTHAVKSLTDRLTDPDWWLRLTAARAIAKLCSSAAPEWLVSATLPALIAALRDPDENVRRQAILALARMEAHAAPATAALVELLGEEPLAGIAAEALAKIGPASVAPLTAALGTNGGSTSVRTYAAYALKKLGTAEALAPLERCGAQPVTAKHEHFFQVVPNSEFVPEERHAFEALFQETLARGAGSIVEYTQPFPKHDFLRYLVLEKGCMIHGSNRTDIDVLQPVRRSTDSGRHGNQNAVYADPDWLRPIYFAIVDRKRVNGLSNGFQYLKDGETTTGRFYHFSITAESLRHDPWTEAMIYVLPRDTFEEQGEWISRRPVQPLLKLPVSPSDFPFLNEIRGLDHRLGMPWIRLNGFPWLDEAARFLIRRR